MEGVHLKRNSIWPIYLVFFVDNFGFSLVFTLFGPLLLNPQYAMVDPSYYASTRNLLIAFLYAVFPLAQFIGAPYIGDLADHFGRKKAFLVTLGGAIIGYTLSAFSVLIHNYSILLISRFITGFSACNLSVCLASIADLSSSERQRGRQYGFIAGVAGISWILSMIVGSYLSDPNIKSFLSPAVPFVFCVILALTAILGVIFFYHETRAIKDKRLKFQPIIGLKNIMTAFKIREIRFLYCIYFIWIIGWGIVLQWYTPYSIEKFSVKTEDIAWGLILFGLAWAIGGSSINYLLLRRVSSKNVTAIGLIGLSLTVLICSWAKDFESFSLAFIISAAFGGIIMPNLLNLLSISAPYHMQGKVLGISQSLIATSWIVAPLIAGVIADINVLKIYFVAAFFILTSFILLSIYLRRNRNAKEII